MRLVAAGYESDHTFYAKFRFFRSYKYSITAMNRTNHSGESPKKNGPGLLHHLLALLRVHEDRLRRGPHGRLDGRGRTRTWQGKPWRFSMKT